jgi:hypothetical protein
MSNDRRRIKMVMDENSGIVGEGFAELLGELLGVGDGVLVVNVVGFGSWFPTSPGPPVMVVRAMSE